MNRDAVTINKRRGRYYVHHEGRLVEQTGDIGWALYRYALVMPISKSPIVLRAVEQGGWRDVPARVRGEEP